MNSNIAEHYKTFFPLFTRLSCTLEYFTTTHVFKMPSLTFTSEARNPPKGAPLLVDIYSHFLSPCASWTQTLDLGMVRQVFYLCAIAISQVQVDFKKKITTKKI